MRLDQRSSLLAALIGATAVFRAKAFGSFPRPAALESSSSARHPVRALSEWFGARLVAYLSHTADTRGTAAPTDPDKLLACLQPGDVILVEGNSRVSVAIKYLTQSTWSHAALYAGDATGLHDADGASLCFLEADIRDGVRAVGVAAFRGLHCRVCRPVGLRPAETRALIAYVLARLGHRYDLRNVVDLARYLLPTPPVPVRWRRRMLAFGSGDPTRAICSTLIAQAFQSVRYPILPLIESLPSDDPHCPDCVNEILHVRHHSLFVPRDFDVSPYFAIVKPSLAACFDHRSLVWHVPGSHRAGTESQAASTLPEVA